MNIKVTINVTKISNSDRISLPTQIELIENEIFTSEYVYVWVSRHVGTTHGCSVTVSFEWQCSVCM